MCYFVYSHGSMYTAFPTFLFLKKLITFDKNYFL